MWTLNHNVSRFSEEHCVHPVFDPRVKLLQSLSIGQAMEKMRSYTSFVFVRDPIARFIAAYMGKIRSHKMDSRKFVAEARNYCFSFELPRNFKNSNHFCKLKDNI